MDQRQSARLVVGIEYRDEFLQPFTRHARADLHADRIGDATKVLDMCAIDRGSAHADPREVRRQVVPALAAIEKTRLCLFVVQVQAFMRGVDVGPLRFVDLLAGNRLQEIQRIRFEARIDFIREFMSEEQLQRLQRS